VRHVGILTDDFSLFHDVTRLFRDMDIVLRPIEGNAIPLDVEVIITDGDVVEGGRKIPWVRFPDDIRTDGRDDLLDLLIRVELDLALPEERFTSRVGVDPGRRIGVCLVVDGVRIHGGSETVVWDAVDLVRRLLAHVQVTDRTIRVGNGAAVKRDVIINALLPLGVTVEEVDETGTSDGDHSDAADSIARTIGDTVIGTREVVIPEGEVRDIQRQSRKLSGGEFTIDYQLAEEVARGSMSLREAILVFRGMMRAMET